MGLYLEQVDRVLAAIKTASDSPALPNDINDFNDQSQVHGVSLAENIREHFEERSAMRVYEYRLRDIGDNGPWMIYLAPGVELLEAETSLRERFKERLIAVRKHK